MQIRTRLLLAALPLCAALSVQAAAGDPRVALETSEGRIVVELAPDRAPITVKNFLQYVKDGHYAGTIFHRVISGFMIQGGGFTEDMTEKPTRASYPHSATSQFYINVANNDFLNADRAQDGNGYAVFGRVVEGEDVVDKIAAVKTTVRRGMGDVPVKPVKILKAEILK